MSAKTFTYSLTIIEEYIDRFGHMNHAVYVTLFEKARLDFVTKNGFGLKEMQERKLGPVILEFKLKFLKELYLNDQIMIETTLVSYRKKIGVIHQTMRRNGVICCEATFVIGLFDLQARKLVNPTAEWLRAIGME